MFSFLLTPFLLHVPLGERLSTPELRDGIAPLNVITLMYDQSTEHKNIEHNCAMISRTSHKFIVYTDDMDQPYCDVCECKRFVKKHCPCPSDEDGCDMKNPCEKLFFFIEMLGKYRELVLLDNDLLILKDYFLDRLQARSKAHDFLATYGHSGIMNATIYRRNFNSGLVFIRWLPGLNYTDMKDVMYRCKSRNDQGIISEFVQEYYDNWDTLSWKWHCRGLKALKQDLPVRECYTIHDRNEVEEVLQKLGMQRLRSKM